MSTLYNRARVNTATAGTGTMTLGAAVSDAYFTFAEAGVPNAAVVSYVIEDGTDVEMGIGTYTSAGTTLSRTTVTASKISGTAGTTKLTLSGSAVVFIDALAADITVPPASSIDNAVARYDGTTGRAIQGTNTTIEDSGTLNISQAARTGSNSVNVYAITDTATDEFAYMEFGYWLRNLAATPINKQLFAFGAEGEYTDSSVVSSYDWYLYDFITPAYVIQIAANDISLLYPTSAIVQDSATTTVSIPLILRHHTDATPANGIGTGVQFITETAVSNYEIGSIIESVAVDTTSTSEDFDLVFKGMAAGAAAAERFRIKSTNTLVSPSGQVAHFWVYWTGASTTILASHNVASIDNDATGDAGINLTTAFSSANYAAFVTTNETGTDGWDADSIQSCGINVHTAGVIDVLCGVMVDGGTAAGNTTNPDQWNACGFGVSA
jgi:hypothetical protein